MEIMTKSLQLLGLAATCLLSLALAMHVQYYYIFWKLIFNDFPWTVFSWVTFLKGKLEIDICNNRDSLCNLQLLNWLIALI